jgi:hypothetical protein
VFKLRVESSGWDPRYDLLLDLSLRLRGGYPMQRSDLTDDWWRALGILEEERERQRFRDLAAIVGTKLPPDNLHPQGEA